MTEPEPTVALVFSPETWVEELHRHLADHGGARVRLVVVEPMVALDEEYDTILVSDRWPALTRSFVEAVHVRGRRVLGVFDPDEPAGKDHLLALRVDATIPSDAAMAEFVAAVVAVVGLVPSGSAAAQYRWNPSPPVVDLPDPHAAPRGRLVGVTGTRGSGVTEVALALAAAAASRTESVVLVDAHESAPGLAVRLGLGLDSNLRRAVDARAYGLGDLNDSILRSAIPGLDVVGGFPSARAATEVTASDVLDVLVALQRAYRHVVVDLDSGPDAVIGRAVAAQSEAVVGVGTGTPLGVTRLLEWMVDIRTVTAMPPVHVVVNQAPRDRFRKEEIASEICHVVAPASLVLAPHDSRVEDAGWNGDPVRGGPFTAALASLAAEVVPPPAAPRRRWSRRGREWTDR
ncbi:MAG TPA: hypothetical protein VGA62_04275 [Acidimicrobiia bacterium]